MLTSRLLVSVAFSAMLLSAGCTEDPEAAANKLFVEASSAISKATELTATTKEALAERRDLLTLAVGNLEKIVADYPSSSLAVDLAAAGSAKGIVVDDIEEALDVTSRELLCLEKPDDGGCFLDQLVKEEMSLALDAQRRSTLVAVLAANGQFEEAIALAETLDGNEREYGAQVTAVFGALLGEPDIENLVGRVVDEGDQRMVEDFFKQFRAELSRSGWKVVSPVSSAVVTPDVPAGLEVEEALEGVGALLLAGQMKEAQSQINVAFLVTKKKAIEDQTSRSYRTFKDTLLEELDSLVR